MRGARIRAERDGRALTAQAWAIAALTRAEKLPKLEKLIGKSEPSRRRVPWQERLAGWQAYAAAKGATPP